MDKKEGPADVTSTMTEASEARAGMLPIDMVNALAELVDPIAVAKEMPWLAGEMTKIALGKSDISFDERDQRFTDEAWRTVPYFRILGQSYRLFELGVNRMYESGGGSWQEKARASFTAAVVTSEPFLANFTMSAPSISRSISSARSTSIFAGRLKLIPSCICR